jgi:hypothetical protein
VDQRRGDRGRLGPQGDDMVFASDPIIAAIQEISAKR